MSQDEFAAAIRDAGRKLGEPNDASKRLVQRWESGEHRSCRPVYRRALEEATGRRFEELGFTKDDVMPLDRRALLAAGAIVASGAALSEPFDRLRRALQFPTRLDAAGLEFLEKTTAEHFTQEEEVPARLLAEHVGGHVDLLSLLLAGASDRYRTQLSVMAGEAAALAGWLRYDLGDLAGARGYWGTAIEAAKTANDGPLLACVLAYLSYLTSAQGDPKEAYRLLSAAGEQVRSPQHAAARSWISARAAEEAATLGDPSALVSLERAMTSFDYVQPDTGRPWVKFFNNARLGSMAVTTYSRLGHPEVESAADAVMGSLGENERKIKAVILADVAGGHATRGDFDAACGLAEKSLEATLSGEAVLGRERLTALAPTLRASGAAQAVDLADRIDSVF
ncbi:MAG TPA: hypothetical protein VGS97_09715 [Actinocrinis sp.]|nr:hypothetical protein [Actinocrinis sp.]